MNHVVGPNWRDQWDVVITSAGKPAFYTEDNRPFREVDIYSGKVKFKQVKMPFLLLWYKHSCCEKNMTTQMIILLNLGSRPGKGTCLLCWMPV